MAIEIKPVRSNFVGEVVGVDIGAPLSAEQIAAVEAGMDAYAVLVFRDQKITNDQQIAFSRGFGEIELARDSNVDEARHRRLPSEFADISNLDSEANLLARDDRRRMFNLGNRLWHSDSSFRAVPAKYSLLSARTVPSQGGDTQFADMRAAHDRLDRPTRAMVEDLVCHHSLIYSRGRLGFDDFTTAEAKTFAPVRQRLVRSHPVTGRKSLFLSAHIGEIEGWRTPEARALIRDLIEDATAPDWIYAHRWRRYDLVMWDNRQTMHRARPFKEDESRDLRRTTIVGDAETIAQAA